MIKPINELLKDQDDSTKEIAEAQNIEEQHIEAQQVEGYSSNTVIELIKKCSNLGRLSLFNYKYTLCLFLFYSYLS